MALPTNRPSCSVHPSWLVGVIKITREESLRVPWEVRQKSVESEDPKSPQAGNQSTGNKHGHCFKLHLNGGLHEA